VLDPGQEREHRIRTARVPGREAGRGRIRCAARRAEVDAPEDGCDVTHAPTMP